MPPLLYLLLLFHLWSTATFQAVAITIVVVGIFAAGTTGLSLTAGAIAAIRTALAAT